MKRKRNDVRKGLCALALLAAVGAAQGAMTNAVEAASTKERVLFFVAHPDDTIACAGTMFLMKDRFELHVGVLTHGERGLGEKGFRDGSTKATRTREEEAAAAMVGAKVHWFDEVDGDAYPNRDVCRQVANLLMELKPRAIVAMWPLDYHLDHAMSSACLQKAIGLVGMREVVELYFMEQSYDTRTFVPAHYVDVSDVLELKRAFIRQHVSQNRDDRMCALEMSDAAMRAQRCAPVPSRPLGGVGVQGHDLSAVPLHRGRELPVFGGEAARAGSDAGRARRTCPSPWGGAGRAWTLLQRTAGV